MNRRTAIALMGVETAARAKPAAQDRFVGVWKLVSCERKRTDGRMDFPYGKEPVGRLTYDKTGRMSALLMRPGRRSTMPPGVNLASGNASAEEIREAVEG